MKNATYLLSLLLLFACNSGFGQAYTIKSYYGNALYIDDQNTLVIDVPGYEKSQVTVYLDSEKIRGYEGRYTFYVPECPIGQAVKVKVFVTKELKEELVGEHTFFVGRKSPYSVMLGEFKSRDNLTIAQFAEIDSLTLLAPPGCKILHYASAVVPRKDPAEFYQGMGSKLGDQLLTGVSRTSPGTKVIFDEIIIENNLGEKIKASPVILTIKE